MVTVDICFCAAEVKAIHLFFYFVSYLLSTRHILDIILSVVNIAMNKKESFLLFILYSNNYSINANSDCISLLELPCHNTTDRMA